MFCVVYCNNLRLFVVNVFMSKFVCVMLCIAFAMGSVGDSCARVFVVSD